MRDSVFIVKVLEIYGGGFGIGDGLWVNFLLLKCENLCLGVYVK